MNILALDPATNCGFAHSDGRHGVWHLGTGNDPSKLAALAEHIRSMMPVDMIGLENASFGATPSGKGRQIQWSQVVWQNKLRGVVELIAGEHN